MTAFLNSIPGVLRTLLFALCLAASCFGPRTARRTAKLSRSFSRLKDEAEEVIEGTAYAAVEAAEQFVSDTIRRACRYFTEPVEAGPGTWWAGCDTLAAGGEG